MRMKRTRKDLDITTQAILAASTPAVCPYPTRDMGLTAQNASILVIVLNNRIGAVRVGIVHGTRTTNE